MKIELFLVRHCEGISKGKYERNIKGIGDLKKECLSNTPFSFFNCVFFILISFVSSCFLFLFIFFVLFFVYILISYDITPLLVQDFKGGLTSYIG